MSPLIDTPASATRDQLSKHALVGLGAPELDEDVAIGWRALTTWAEAQVAEREGNATAQRQALAAAERNATVSRGELDTARQAVATARTAESAALRAQQQAVSEGEAAEQRLRALVEALAGRPDDATAAAEITRATELEAAAREADLVARTARTALRDAETAATAVEAEFAQAWDVVRRTRDPLVGLGAPTLTGDDLPQAWAALTGWATSAAAEQATRGTEAATVVERAADRRRELEARVAGEFEACGLPAGGVDTAAARAAAALQEARSALDRVVERRAEVSRLVAEREEAATAHQVAKLLGDQLRSSNFPRWLVASALDVLVADASESLRELSGGQFELTHEAGDFVVVDHADADSRRPVKTLSGGETFQASLALALALSSQLAGLAAEGAPRLESIFLDEGFGTLDESNLETVASTLENLATRGDRMVGVITHVPALAERIPARFSLSRDQRTSTIVREGP
ncbi:SbcC/MukB-like Walker B domain-containing protein [Pseudonocardia sp. H11422]|uniref:SbcC/MukB-like Walker B domain-containing protein n=1 Tax=Pseudonocardia sp. H11422 TaxID=2835866 RepID=UPI00202801D6|nr:SbcC/MukB-like Walker B domain-containing protein [Pseudonocardia sp. H11422]